MRGNKLRQLSKTFSGLIGFIIIVSLSFLIITDAHITRNFPIIWTHISSYEPTIVAGALTQTPAPAPIAAQPRPVITDEPRFVVNTANEHISAQGYNYTVYVAFGDVHLAFHISEAVLVEDAMPTIEYIVKQFDLVHDYFSGLPPLSYFIVAEPGNFEQRQINYSFAESPVDGYVANLYFSHGYRLPLWLSMGLEAYITSCTDVNPLTSVELEDVFRLAGSGAPYGDAWFVPNLAPRNVPHNMRDIAYSLVRIWSENGTLYKLVGLAQSDTHAFARVLHHEFDDAQSTAPVLQFVYKAGDIEVITACASYVFVYDSYQWTWARITAFVYYMEASIEFVRDHFMITHERRIPITLYPFGLVNIPDSIAHMAYEFGWSAPDVNFVTNDQIILASTSRLGPWAVAHEVVHIMLFREFPDYHPHTWLVEGMAVLGEMLFREAFTGTRPYSFTVPLIGNIDNLARNSAGHVLPVGHYQQLFGRERWTYDEIGSFTLYLYRRFGMELLLGLYRSNGNTQFEIAYELFEHELTELIYSWRRSLWPNGEPAGWW